MIDWDRENLIAEVVSVIKEKELKGEIEFKTDELKEVVKIFYRGHPTEELKSKILYLAWSIPSGALPVAGEAVIHLLVEEAFKKNAE